VRIFDSVCFHRIKLTSIRQASKPAHREDKLGGFGSMAVIGQSKNCYLSVVSGLNSFSM
jgi:hypothetical protein